MAKEGRGHAQFITGTERMQPKVSAGCQRPVKPCAEHHAFLDRRLIFSSGDAVAAVRLAADCERHLSQVGFAKESHRHSPLSANHSHLSGSEVTGLLSAQWKGGNRNPASESPSIHLCPSVCLYPNVPSVTLMFSSDFKRRKWLCDSGVQVARSSVFGPPPV